MHGWDCRIPAAASEPAYWTRKEPIMSKQILVISTSLRANSNSDALAEAFAQGAQAAGHHVTRVHRLLPGLLWMPENGGMRHKR